MLTPRFHLDQDDSYVLVTIYAPFTNVSDTEVFMDDTDFRFFSRPYFLRLHLPGQVEETEDARAEYVADKRSFVVRVPKKNPGEHFIGLDMLTSLLTPSLGSLESSSAARAGVQEVTESLEADGSQWFFQQELPQSEEGKEEEIENLESVPGYGFGFRQRGVYSKDLESQEILDVKRPDELDFSQRRELRLEQERAAFSEDHYLCDLFETEEVDRLMSHEHDEDRLTRYSEEEQTKLVSLRKEIPVVGKADRLPVYHGLVDLLFASCYDLRANEGERTSESGWTVGKLSSMLSCNERAESLRECVVAGLRRSLCYPLHRNFGVSLKCFQDVSRVLKLGNVAVVKALTELTVVFSESDRYLFNQLYLEPYAVWAQMIPSSHFESLADALDKVLSGVSKDSLDLDLVELEEAAKLVQKEEEGKKSELCEVADSLKRLEIKAAADSDDDDNSSSSDDDNSLESSEEEESSSEEDETSSEKEVPKEHKASDDRVKDDDKESGSSTLADGDSTNMTDDTDKEDGSASADFHQTVLRGATKLVAPMVDASELAWRMLARNHGAELCFTPMFHSGVFIRDEKYRRDALQTCPEDRPLIVQFCANKPEVFRRAVELTVQSMDLDAVDLNLGCPQVIARRGHFGSFLQDEWDLIAQLVRAAKDLCPITCKLRIFESVEKTVAYARMMVEAGARALTVHGRTREQKGALTGLASWDHIKAVREAVDVPVFANGNIQSLEDVRRCMRETDVHGVMSAEGHLYNPYIFEEGREKPPPVWEACLEYLDLAEQYPCPLSYSRGHMFKMLHHCLLMKDNADVRQMVAKGSDLGAFREAAETIRERLLPYELGEKEWKAPEELNRFILKYPPWICQSYVRPPPEEHLKHMQEVREREKIKTEEFAKKRESETDEDFISRKKQKKLDKNPNKKFPHARENCKLCAKCPNPAGQKCDSGLCKKCCRHKCYVEELDCSGHRILVKSKREAARKWKQEREEEERRKATDPKCEEAESEPN